MHTPGTVSFGGRGDKGRAKRTIKGETQSISVDYRFLGPAVFLSEPPLLLPCANKDFFALTSAPVFLPFNSLKVKRTRIHNSIMPPI
jgi:hypothetical protein